MSEYVSFSKYWARFAGEMAWGSDVLVFLRGKPCKELGTSRAGGVPVSHWWPLCMYPWICVCGTNGALPAAAEGLWTSRVPVSRCWDPGMLGSRGQVLSKASCWTDTRGTNIHIDISPAHGPSPWSARQEKRWSCWVCSRLCQCWLACLCWSVCPVVYLFILYVCFCVGVYWESVQSWGVWSCDSLTSIRSLDFICKSTETIIYICFTLEMGLV